MKNIAITGVGYVGLSNAILLAQKNKVIALDIDSERVDLINSKISPIVDSDISHFLAHCELDLTATLDEVTAFKEVDFIIIATPTNYDEITHSFDTSSIEAVIEKAMEINPTATLVIKSTIPIGYIESIKKRYNISNIFFSPEFLREGKALHDNLYPSRIILGDKSEKAQIFSNLLKDAAHKKDIEVLFTNSTEAEAIKLFANTYLAMRVAFFNELDTYAEIKGLNSKQIIEGISLDPRIGGHYNNPSFGYGGYCLPKDTKQMLANFEGVPNTIIKAIVAANDVRKTHIADQILKLKPSIVGIYRLTMKTGSDNFRQAAIQDIMLNLKKQGVQVLVYEPTISLPTFEGYLVVTDFEQFKNQSEIIIANRLDVPLKEVEHKVYTRDLFGRD